MVWARGQPEVATPIYDRAKLAPGHTFTGPAVIEQMDSTCLVGPGQRASVDEYLNLIIELE